ncbi:DUF6318 family protein [Actinomyces sp. ICM47]|uniref:DUF6318 family protein n=1 Tax=Actinomyces sp. ICM47 TaxID=936548 RepID=UPI00027336C7|nr:DUF6318 family protein [Actinomyces sp. ICM47]EJG14980.1 hypothetical protein HMPREF1136_1511 [Actinomyces sp. ICM47]
MMVPPLSERPVTEEDEEQFRRESMPRTYTLRQRWADYRAEAKANRPKGVKARVRAWLHVEPFYWGMRAAYVVLVVGAVFAVYINGVAEGWWHAWGEKPTVAATTPAARPAPSASSSTEAAMSGGYQIGPDGVLVRPAEHAASTYAKPELPEEAKENTERGAELAAEYYHALMGYSWNTGDTSALLGMSDPDSTFATSYADDVAELYSNGWAYGSESEISHIVRVEPIPENGNDVRRNTIAVTFQLSSKTGVLCQGQKIVKRDREYQSLLTLYMTWQDDHWIETQGSLITDASK